MCWHQNYVACTKSKAVFSCLSESWQMFAYRSIMLVMGEPSMSWNFTPWILNCCYQEARVCHSFCVCNLVSVGEDLLWLWGPQIADKRTNGGPTSIWFFSGGRAGTVSLWEMTLSFLSVCFRSQCTAVEYKDRRSGCIVWWGGWTSGWGPQCGKSLSTNNDLPLPVHCILWCAGFCLLFRTLTSWGPGWLPVAWTTP